MARVTHTPYGFPPHAPFRRRVERDTVSGDGISASRSMRRRVVFLPGRRVLAPKGRGHGGGRLKPVHPFLSLLHVQVQESPPVLSSLHFGPYSFNFIYDHDLCYISLDFVRLSPSIEIN